MPRLAELEHRGDAGLGYYIQIATGDLRMDLAFTFIMLAGLGLALLGASCWPSGC